MVGCGGDGQVEEAGKEAGKDGEGGKGGEGAEDRGTDRAGSDQCVRTAPRQCLATIPQLQSLGAAAAAPVSSHLLGQV